MNVAIRIAWPTMEINNKNSNTINNDCQKISRDIYI